MFKASVLAKRTCGWMQDVESWRRPAVRFPMGIIGEFSNFAPQPSAFAEVMPNSQWQAAQACLRFGH